jgi:hypothetical protein
MVTAAKRIPPAQHGVSLQTGQNVATQILRNCHRATRPGSKVLIVDAVILSGNSAHFGKLLDLEMLVLTPRGRERTQAEFRELLKRSGFRLRRVVSTDTHLSIVEGVRA